MGFKAPLFAGAIYRKANGAFYAWLSKIKNLVEHFNDSYKTLKL